MVVPLSRADATGAVSDSSGKTGDSRHSRSASLYRPPVFLHWDLITPVSSSLTPLHLSLFPATLSISRHALLLFPNLLFFARATPDIQGHHKSCTDHQATFIHLPFSGTCVTRFSPRTKRQKSSLYPILFSNSSSIRSDIVSLPDQDPYHHN